MAHTLTESPTFTANVDVPDDGDDLEAASVETPLQALTNRTKLFRDYFNSAAQIPSFIVAGTAEFNGIILADGGVTAAGIITTTITGTGLATFSSLSCSGGSTFLGLVTASSNLSVTGVLAVVGSAVVTGNLTVIAGSTISTEGGLINRILQGPDANATINPHLYDYIHTANGSLTGNRSWVCANSGVDGLVCRILNHATSGGDLLMSVGPDNATLEPGEEMVIHRKAGQWRIMFTRN